MRALGSALVILVAATSSIALAAPAAAPKVPPPPIVKAPLLTPVVTATKWSVSNAFENDMHDAMDVAASSPLTGGTALAGFRFRFGNGDHKLRRFGVTPKGSYANFAYADSNGDDPFAAMASWAVINTAKAGSVSAAGGGQFEIPIPGGKLAGHKLVLSGFEFRRQDNTDANVRSVGVWLDSERATARVMLMDDQGPDFRGFESKIGAALLGMPMGELKATVDTMLTATGRVNGGAANGKYRAFAITVNYAWVPDAAVASTDVFTGTGRTPASGKVFPQNGVLQGFEYYFTNSDHNIMDLGVIGPLSHPPASIPVLIPPNGETIEYQDVNRDDPMRWAVQYANLHPSAK
jgi:hypothetical protein